MSVYDLAPINSSDVDGGGYLIPPKLPHANEQHNSLYNDYVLNGIDVDGGYVPWHPVIEARAMFVHDFIATKMNAAFLWHDGGPTGECFAVPCVPDELCTPCVPDTFDVPSGGKPC